MVDPFFTAPDAWHGGFYELAMELGPPSVDRLRAAVEAVWSHPDLDGCYLDRDREPADQPRVQPDLRDDGAHLRGVARLPNGRRVPCGTCVIAGSDAWPEWLDFYLPLGSLNSAYPCGGFPFPSGADYPGPWRLELEDWLAGVGDWVAKTASFRLGLIGFEVSGDVSAAEVAAQGVPAETYMGYLWPTNGAIVYHRRSVIW